MSYTAIPFYSPEESLRLIMGKWKLTGQNFPVWKMHLDNVLNAQGKRYVIEKPISRPKCNSPEKDFADYFKFMVDESDVMSILSFSTSPEFMVDLRVKYCHEVVKNIESLVGFYKNSGKYLIMKEIYSLKLEKGQSVKDHLLEMRRLFKSLSRMGYKMVQEELVHLMWFSLTDEIRTTASEYMGEPKMDVAKFHEDILASLEPRPAAAAELMDGDWIDELGDLSCPNAEFKRRETLRKDRSNLRVGEGTMLVAEAVGSYNLSLPSGLVLELENCYYMCVDGPFSHEARGGYRYFITFTDDFSRKIKFLSSDRGGEYLSQEFDNHLMECGIVSQLIPPYTPQMNVSFWGHALEPAAHILNRVPTKSMENTLYEIWTGKNPKLSFLKIWGCEVYVKRPTSEKLKPKSDKCIFVGYPKTTVGYYFYNPTENKVFVARNGEFLEDKFLNTENATADVQPAATANRRHHRIVVRLVYMETQQPPPLYHRHLRPVTTAARTAPLPESEQWQEAMEAEMQSMYDNQVWELTNLPQHCRAVGRKWVFKNKTNMDGNVHTFKARLVAKRILMAISAYFNYEIWQMDVKTAFLNRKLIEDIYMQQPEGFVDPKNPNKVYKLLKSIYGLKQASRSWNLHFDVRIKEFGFTKSEFEPCVYTKFSGSIVTFLVLYVDDILLIGNDVPTLQSVKAWLSRCFQMKDVGEAAYILGIKIYRNRSRRLIGLSQKQDKMKSVPYAFAIGLIMYAMLCTRPDVAYLVSVTSRYQQNPGEAYWVAVKNILKYMRRTKKMFLVFGGSEDEISVTGYTDASFQTNRDDFKSQSGYVFTLNGGAISWKSSKQDTIADSTTEAE
ncbi:hypothetical protein OSB04_028115 [Centaurea solstitialis]|uniref:Reverse transcriptase Ty1/copia-type domain-containing protein n=1 Tax=Centaurea solstitialis TaxID=347529 RepID=A0AA38W8X4_9ASTR|nr:hypothetical protein OSB04_028115 [Centaurea solstitialis]